VRRGSLRATIPPDRLREVAGDDGSHGLRRALGPAEVMALGAGAVVGAGIFVFTGVAAALCAGLAVPLSMVIARVACVRPSIGLSAAIAAAPLACGRSPAPGRDFDSPSRVDTMIARHMRSQGIPGLALVVVRSGRVVDVRGVGVADGAGTPVTDSTLFQLGSVTKMLTGTVAAALSARGAVDLNAPVGGVLDGLPDWAARLTLHQLLSDTAGLRDQPADSGSHDEAALLAFVRHWSPDYALLPAGVVFSYSNPGYALAGATLEAAVGVPFAELFRAQLLEPLGMRDATFRPADAERRPHTTGFTDVPGGRLRPLPRPADDTRFWPAGYLRASARDLARALNALLDDGRLDGRRVLPAHAVRRVRSPVVRMTAERRDTWYGYGTIIEPRPEGGDRVWHDGAMPGFSALVAMVPRTLSGVAVLANREGVDLHGIAEALLDGGERGAQGIPPPVPQAPVPGDEARALLGRYVNRWTLELTLLGDTLVLRRFGQTLPVARTAANRYLVVGSSGPADVFRMLPGRPGIPDCLLMYLWAFCRESPDAAGADTFSRP
jgi:CubicO group peptidase (beta-lactamase class C family)